MEYSTIYVLPLDLDNDVEEDRYRKYRSIYKDKTIESVILLPFFENEITNILVIGISHKHKEIDIKKMRQILRKILKDDYKSLEILDKSWINLINIDYKTVHDIAIKAVIEIMKFIEKYELKNPRLIFDFSLLKDYFIRHFLYKALSIVITLLNSSSECRVYDRRVVNSDNSIIEELQVERYVNGLISIIELLEIFEKSRMYSKKDKHFIRSILLKILEIKENIENGNLFSALRSYRDLASVVDNALSSIDNRDVKYVVSSIVLREIEVVKEDKFPEVVKKFIQTFSKYDNYVLNISRMFIFYIVIRLLQECCYYGYLDRETINIDNIIKILTNMENVRCIIAIYGRSELLSLYHYVEKLVLCGFYRDFCEEHGCDSVEDIGRVECKGSIRISDIKKLLLSCLDILDVDFYDYCDTLQKFFERLDYT